jgi:hypothetical protein
VNDQKCSQPRIRGLTSGPPGGGESRLPVVTPPRLRQRRRP